MRLLFLALVGFAVLGVDAGRFTRQASTCTNPRGEEGTCISIRQCPALLNLLRTQRTQPGVAEFLRNSVCGGSNANPSLCCPSTAEPPAPTPPTVTRVSAADSSKLLSPPQCGTSGASDQMKIVGGNPSVLGAWPWIAALGYRSSTRPGPRWLCGGSLISSKYIITAAHCTKHPSLTLYLARLGDLDLNNTSDGASPLDVNIEKAIAHSGYSTTKRSDDIALLKLRDAVPFSRNIQPICLPKTAELKAMNFERFSPFAAGWGSTSFKGPASTQLMEVQLPIWTNDACKTAYTSRAQIFPSQMCAGFTTGGKDACQGDSGGPLMWPKGSSYYLIGVVSYGFKCAEPGFPGVYARVTSYIDWIEKNMD